MPSAPISPAEAAQIKRDMAMFYQKTVVVNVRTGLNDYAEGVYGPDASYTQARIQGKVQQIRTATGEERTSTQIVHILGNAVVSPDDKITLPGDVARYVLAVSRSEIGVEVLATQVYL